MSERHVHLTKRQQKAAVSWHETGSPRTGRSYAAEAAFCSRCLKALREAERNQTIVHEYEHCSYFSSRFEVLWLLDHGCTHLRLDHEHLDYLLLIRREVDDVLIVRRSQETYQLVRLSLRDLVIGTSRRGQRGFHSLLTQFLYVRQEREQPPEETSSWEEVIQFLDWDGEVA